MCLIFKWGSPLSSRIHTFGVNRFYNQSRYFRTQGKGLVKVRSITQLFRKLINLKDIWLRLHAYVTNLIIFSGSKGTVSDHNELENHQGDFENQRFGFTLMLVV